MILQTAALTKCYGSFCALDRLNLDVRPGEILGLLGPNGSGKSTALRLLLGFLRPTSGSAQIAGFDCWRDSVEVRRRVAYLPGELRLYENMTGEQLVRFLSKLRSEGEPPDLHAAARAFDIDVTRPLSQLSSGMKRKVALLAVLLPRTPLVILDEPTNTLDPAMRDELLEQLVRSRERGQAVLFSSHVLGEVEQVCDRVAILREGKLAHVQEMADLRELRRIHVAFNGPAPPVPVFNTLHTSEPNGTCITLEWSGPLKELLAWLAAHDVADLHIEPLGLSGIYQRFHTRNGMGKEDSPPVSKPAAMGNAMGLS
jgi:ABC-2 type transport system ATP-binding protein